MIALLLQLTVGVNLDGVEWRSLLNANLVYDIAPVSDGAWCATNGGVRFFSLADSAFTLSFTNVDGLPHNTCRCIASVESGELWVGTDRGLALVVPSSGEVAAHPQITGRILSLALNGDTLAVGKPDGVFLIRMMGTPASLADDDVWLPSVLADAEARTMCWFSGDLWIGAEDGLMRYRVAQNELERFSTSSGLASKDIRDLAPADSLYVLTAYGVSRYDDLGERFYDVFRTEDDSDTALYYTSLACTHDTFYVASASGKGYYKRLVRYRAAADSLETLGFWIDVPQGTGWDWARYLEVVRIDGAGRVWIGLGPRDSYWGQGLILWNGEWRTRWDGEWSFDCPGMNSNYAWHVLLDGAGGVWTSHWRSHYERGVTRYSDAGWENLYGNDTVPLSNSTKVSAVDSRGRLVFGSWWASSGVVRYDPASGEWDEYSWGQGVALNITAWLAVDMLDRIWVSNFYAQRMSVLSPELEETAVISWPYEHVHALEFDSSGVVWAGTDVGLVSYRPPDFKSTLEGGVFTTEVPGPPVVLDITLDGADGVWGVTPEGAFHWTPEETVWYGDDSPLPETDLVSVERDPWGRIYFLCRNEGVVVYDPAGAACDTSCGLWQVISPDDHPLIPGYEYTWLDVDRTGHLAVGTLGGGVSLLELPPYVDSTSQQVSVYPNPCYASFGLPVRFTPLDGAQAVLIYTLAGELVKRISPEEFTVIQGVKQAEFDVSGMSAGLYFAVVRFPDHLERVKFVVLR